MATRTTDVPAAAIEVLVGLGMDEADAREQLAKGYVNLFPYRQYVTDEAVIALATHCAGLTTIDLSGCGNITDEAVIALATHCAGLTTIDLSWCENITDEPVIALAENCEYLENIYCDGTKVTATGRALIKEIKTRPKPPPLEKGWWLDMDDGTGPRCKGMMN
jgi:hypothetical protein